MFMDYAKWLIIAIPLFVLYAVFTIFSVPFAEGELTVRMYDIGQGDGILIYTPEGKTIVVDGGPDRKAMADFIQQDKGLFDKTIDLVVLSHPDSDHIHGLLEIFERFSVNMLLVNYMDDDPALQELIELAESKGTEVKTANVTEDLMIDQFTLLDIVAPLGNLEEEEESNNNRSLVFRLISGKNTMLFTGDIELEKENVLLRSGALLRADFLKGAHHGSSTSTSKAFLSAVSPKTVFFQNGKDNTYGHPKQEVLDRILESGSDVYNTSLSGTITLQCTMTAICTISQQYEQEY